MPIKQIITRYLDLPNAEEAEKFLEQHEALLRVDVEQCLAEMIDEARKKNDLGRVVALKSYRQQLRLFRTQGIAQGLSLARLIEGGELGDTDTHLLVNGFLEFSEAETWEDRRAILAEHPELLVPQLEGQFKRTVYPVVDRFIQESLNHPDRSNNALKLRIATIYLALCRDMGVEQAEKWFEEQLLAGRETLQVTQNSALPFVFRLLMADSLETAKNVIKTSPELLAPSVDEVFDELIRNAEKAHDMERISKLTFNHMLLKECRTRDIDEVLDDFNALSDAEFDLDGLFEILQEFVSATLADKRLLIKQNPLLLSPIVEVALQMSAVGQPEDSPSREYIEQNRYLLRYCREKDADRFLRELEKFDQVRFQTVISDLVRAADWEHVHTILEQHPEIVSFAAEYYLEGLIEAAEEFPTDAALERLQTLFALIREGNKLGVEEAVKQLSIKGELKPVSVSTEYAKTEIIQEAQLFSEFLNAHTWTEAKELIDKYPQLLSGEMAGVVDGLIELFRNQDAALVDKMIKHRDILEQCTLLGVDAVFSDLQNRDKLEHSI